MLELTKSIRRRMSSASPQESLGAPAPLYSVARMDSFADEETLKKDDAGKCIPDSDIFLARKAAAEFIGTFMLVFCALAGPIVNEKFHGAESLLGNAACSGLAVMVIILSIGHISGAHLNPAVTISFAAFRHFPWCQVPAYVAAQTFAGICASFALKFCFHPFMSGGVTVPSVGYGQVFAIEFIVTAFLMFVITAVATDTKAVGELAGIAIGTTVLLDILVAGPATGGSMNPARSLGPAIAAGNYTGIWIYLTAPILGALAGASVYSIIRLPQDKSSESTRPARSFCRRNNIPV